MVLKKELTFVLPYLGKLLFDLRTMVRGIIERNLPYCKLKLIFRFKCTLNTLFHFNDSLGKKIRKFIVIRVVTATRYLWKKLSSLLYQGRLE